MYLPAQNLTSKPEANKQHKPMREKICVERQKSNIADGHREQQISEEEASQGSVHRRSRLAKHEHAPRRITKERHHRVLSHVRVNRDRVRAELLPNAHSPVRRGHRVEGFGKVTVERYSSSGG